jgi:putative hemolysin
VSSLDSESVRSPARRHFDHLVPDYEHRKGRYLVRFARGAADVDLACLLRYEVFNLELGEGLEGSRATGRDRDPFDDQCQHLLVFDTKTGQMVGTYRLQVRESAEAGHGFYSATEFDLSSLPSEMVDGIVELGRACTSIEHRTPAVIQLLWRGMIAYLRHNRRRYFFGCSSLTSQDPALGIATHEHLLAHGHGHPFLDVQPLPAYACVATEPNRTRVKVPKLFAMYLRQGAKVCGPPALDRYFGTIDYLTLIDLETIDPKILAPYN